MTFQIKRANKSQSKLRMGLGGISGSGKTFSALKIATGLASSPDRIILIDTEHGSASKYADQFVFDVLELDDYHPQHYIDAIEQVGASGLYEVLIIDSLSHAWSGKGGVLEIVDKAAKRTDSKNTFAAWRDATPLHNQLVETMLAAPMHLICTMRSKTEYVLEKDERGRMSPRKVGLAPVQREGMEYEFDLFATMNANNDLIVEKTRIPSLFGKVINQPGLNFAKALREWLESGEAMHWAKTAAGRQFNNRMKELGLSAAFVIANLEPEVTLTKLSDTSLSETAALERLEELSARAANEEKGITRASAETEQEAEKPAPKAAAPAAATSKNGSTDTTAKANGGSKEKVVGKIEPAVEDEEDEPEDEQEEVIAPTWVTNKSETAKVKAVFEKYSVLKAEDMSAAMSAIEPGVTKLGMTRIPTAEQYVIRLNKYFLKKIEAQAKLNAEKEQAAAKAEAAKKPASNKPAPSKESNNAIWSDARRAAFDQRIENTFYGMTGELVRQAVGVERWDKKPEAAFWELILQAALEEQWQVISQRIHYVAGKDKKTSYIAFETEIGTMRWYKGTTALVELLSDGYCRANQVEAWRSLTEARNIEPLVLDWSKSESLIDDSYYLNVESVGLSDELDDVLTGVVKKSAQPEDEDQGDDSGEVFSEDDDNEGDDIP